MKKLSIFVLVVFAASMASATTYVPMKLSGKVMDSPLILLGKIASVACIDPKGYQIGPGKMCTAPGLENKKSYEFIVKRVLKDNTNSFADKKLPQTIAFSFTSMSHLEVPKDNYASAIGQEKILFLRIDDGSYHPLHSAFYFEGISMLPEVQKLITKR